ncbi:MAG: phosphate signaling complex protein PhoU [Deltaproteobacteria bacterium]|nr:phosphate signaling complex protein PhoU [Deltaproteobacteria bacterium]MBW2416619.1 phosphate signaling complex protein PhoU [Deltaproteobacteria bacterium]
MAASTHRGVPLAQSTHEPVYSELRTTILRMGALAEAILDKAARSVRERDARLAAEVNADDLEIDRLDIDVDEGVLRALALRAPVAEDLRTVFAIKTMATDLERIGDLARNIACSARRLAERPDTSEAARLEPLEEAARQLLRRALDAFRDHDASAAQQVIEGDDQVDALQDQIVRDQIARIEANPSHAAQSVDVILIAESLERVADHATNIAEDVILVAEARNVKHAGKLDTPA